MLSITQPRRASTHKAVILGEHGVGKSTITTQFFDPCGDDEYRRQIEVDGEQCMVEVLDTVENAEYEALRNQWIRDGEVFMIVFSLSSRRSFSRAKKYYQQIQAVKKTTVPLILLGNKSDRAPEVHEVSAEQGEALAQEFGCRFMMASAKFNKNIHESFTHLVRLNIKQREEQKANEEAAAAAVTMSQPRGSKVQKKTWKKRLSILLAPLTKGNRG